MVARELVDSSQSIAWLNAEKAAQQKVRAELEEVQRSEGWLRQSVQSLLRNAHVDDLGFQASPDDSKAEMDEFRSGQMSSVNEALRTAWEAEAREHRMVQKTFEALSLQMQPIQEDLYRLTNTLRHWREDLLRTGHTPDGAHPAFQQALPAPPAELSWEDQDSTSDAVRALCACLEALTSESRRRLYEAVGASRRMSSHDGLLLQAEALALHEELERCSQNPLQSQPVTTSLVRPEMLGSAEPEAPASVSAISPRESTCADSAAPSPSRPGTPARPEQAGTAQFGGEQPGSGRFANSADFPQQFGPDTQTDDAAYNMESQTTSAVQRVQHLSELNGFPQATEVASQATAPPAWPASPIPRPRSTASIGVGSQGLGTMRGSVASSMSSVSLHDRRSAVGAPPVASVVPNASGVAARAVSAINPAAPADTATSEVPVSSAALNEESAAKRLNELQRQVNELTRMSMRPKARPVSGPLYRLDRDPGNSPERPSFVARGAERGGGSSVRGGETGARRAGGPPRQIPIVRRTGVAVEGTLDDSAERFDDYSVHRPKRTFGMTS